MNPLDSITYMAGTIQVLSLCKTAKTEDHSIQLFAAYNYCIPLTDFLQLIVFQQNRVTEASNGSEAVLTRN